MTQTKRREYWLDKPDEFYWHSRWRDTYIKANNPKPVQFEGYGEIDAFLGWECGSWSVFDGVSGTVLALWGNPNYETPEAAMAAARAYLESVTPEEFRDNGMDRIKDNGLSPRYRWEEYEDD